MNHIEYHLDGKQFKTVSNTEHGEVSNGTIFYYHQDGDTVWATYSGGKIVTGHLLAKKLANGQLDMTYHHINTDDRLMVGKCLSTPQILDDGRIKFAEHWQWLCGEQESGYSEIIEVVK